MTPIEKPRDNDPAWPDMEVVAVLAHSGGGGQGGGVHWCTYIRPQVVWFCVDTTSNTILEKNPFDILIEHTIDIVFFQKNKFYLLALCIEL